MEEFVTRLNKVDDAYYDFIVAVLSYVKRKKGRLETVSRYMDDHPEAGTSDILRFISDQPDFYDDDEY